MAEAVERRNGPAEIKGGRKGRRVVCRSLLRESTAGVKALGLALDTGLLMSVLREEH